jgi:pimeloyl-ACP methyl ester carboxylesterase
VDATLSRDFAEYVRAMKKIEDAQTTRQADADKILQEVEEVSHVHYSSVVLGKLKRLTSTKSLPIRQFLLGNLVREPGEKVQKFRIPLDILGRSLNNLGDFPFKDPNVVRFEKPALFVRGTQSKYVPDDVLPVIGRFFPRFRLSDVDAGHWLISEQPEAFRKGWSRA